MDKNGLELQTKIDRNANCNEVFKEAFVAQIQIMQRMSRLRNEEDRDEFLGEVMQANRYSYAGCGTFP